MNISIKDFDVEMEIKNKGIELDVYNGKDYLADLVITKTQLIWCKGKTSRKNGVSVKWNDFIEYMEGN